MSWSAPGVERYELCKTINALIFQVRSRDSCEAGSLPAESVALEKLSIKREVELDEEEGSSKPPKRYNEAGISDFGRVAFKTLNCNTWLFK